MRLLCHPATLLGVTMVVFWACDPGGDEGGQPDWGALDFSRYVAVGNSLTAGVSDGALYEQAQRNSFPALIARVTGVETDFEQPIMTANGFSWADSVGRMKINLDYSISFLEPGSEANRELARPFNNLGIPLLRVQQLYTVTTSQEAGGNHFFDKVLRGYGRSPLEEALALEPTVITLWAGNNDILEAASLGMVDSLGTATPADEFSAHLDSALSLLTAGTMAPVFIANVPDITTLPYFATLPPYVIDSTTATRYYLYGECEDGVRQLTDEDLLLFWALSDYFTARIMLTLGHAPTPDQAFADRVVLDATEKAEVQQVIAAYNSAIQVRAAAYSHVQVVDIYGRFQEISTSGFEFGTITYTPVLVSFDDRGNFVLNTTASLFSFDGLHPNRVGYAAVANTFIEVMNSAYGAEIPPVEPQDMR